MFPPPRSLPLPLMSLRSWRTVTGPPFFHTIDVVSNPSAPAPALFTNGRRALTVLQRSVLVPWPRRKIPAPLDVWGESCYGSAMTNTTLTDQQLADMVAQFRTAKTTFETSRLGSARGDAAERRMERLVARAEAAGRLTEFVRTVTA